MPPAPLRLLPVQPRSGRLIREQPLLNSFSEWDNVQLVKGAMRQLEQGLFDNASLVVDAMGRDDRISGVLSTRSGALPSLPMEWEPGKGPQANAALRALEDNFERMFPDAQLSQLLEWGLMLGAAPGRLVWDTQGPLWMPRLQVWHPRPLCYRWDEDAFYIGTLDDNEKVVPGDGQWVLFTPYGARRGWMRGRVRSLYVPWLVRQWALRDWARYSEVHGMPIRKAVTPAGAMQEDRDEFLDDVANLGAESVIETRRLSGAVDDTDRYDIELVEALSKSTETFSGLVDKADTCVSINLLGQNLTTEVKGGSYAAAIAHTAIRNDILQADAELLSDFLVTQCLRPWAAVNFGDPDAAPRPCWKTAPPEDKVQMGLAIKNLGDGIASLQATGAKPDIDELLEREGIPTSGKAGEPPKPEVVAGPVAKPGGRQLAASQGERLPAALIEGQLFADEVATEARDAATRVLKPDLETILGLVDKAESFEGLRKALEEHYRGMDRSKLARVLQEALVLAQLSGMHSVLEEGMEDAE